MNALNTQWNGEKSVHCIAYDYIDMGEDFLLRAQFPGGARGAPDSKPEAFTSRLWEWDVIELFLANEQGRYLECNLAPNGAWWAQGFDSVRVPDHGFQCESEIKAQTCNEEVALRINKGFLQAYLGRGEWLGMNVTAILNSPSAVYLSAMILPGTEPDFHQPSTFSPCSYFLNER